MKAQESPYRVNTDWDHERHIWDAWWITHPSGSVMDYGVYHFRKSFELNEVPDSLFIYVSADNRYRMWINGSKAGMGPARGSTTYWLYEKYNIASFLKKGQNLIAVQVFNLGVHRPVAQFSSQTAFILQADPPFGTLMNTGSNWKVAKNDACHPIPVTSKMVKGYYVAGPCDSITGALFPWNWEKSGYNDDSWLIPKKIIRGSGRGYMHGVPWLLVPRTIPPMEETFMRIPAVIWSAGIKLPPGPLPRQPLNLTIEAGDTAVILFDQQSLTTAYPFLHISGGAGSRMKLTYAEALYDSQGRKGNRDETEGKTMIGYYDIFLPGGQDNALFTTLWMRTWRYLQLEIATGTDPLVIHDLYSMFTAYPLVLSASFETTEPLLTRIWNTGWTTARLCANETYMDCPYYEQLQYLGDTRIQALISLYLTGDDRLMRNALKLADESRIPEGLTLARGPSYIAQITPPFSLYWIDMIYDYYMHRQDDEFVRQFLPGIRGVLQWFEDRLGRNNLLGPLDWFNFSDWTPGFKAGAPAGVDTGSSTLITLNYLYALQRTVVLMDHFGKKEEACHYNKQIRSISMAVKNNCFDPISGLYADTPEKTVFSQHTNIFAILTGLVPPRQKGDVMQKILHNKNLIQTTTYYKFYLFEALHESGQSNEYLCQLAPWEEMLNLGLTTFREDDYEDRSDCHAWSASPCYHFLSLVCGIRPISPGFRKIEISPAPGKLPFIRASMPHPAGRIELDLQFNTPGLQGDISLPEGTDGILNWKGRKIRLHSGRQNINLE
jgi:hypothetical protein